MRSISVAIAAGLIHRRLDSSLASRSLKNWCEPPFTMALALAACVGAYAPAAEAQVPAGTLPAADTLPPADTLAAGDTLTATDTLAISDTVTAADTVPRSLAIGMGSVPLLWPTDVLGPLDERRRRSLHIVRDPLGFAGAWRASGVERRRGIADTLWLASLELDKLPGERGAGFRAPPDTAGGAQAEPVRRGSEILPDLLGDYADLDLEIEGQGQLVSQWESFSPCTLRLGESCNAGAVPDFRPEFQLRAVANGTISERIHVNVDFDQTREFEAANNVSVYYQGKADEILRRVELGEVSMQLPRSQFISQGVPAGNFGVQAQAQMGPLNLQAVVAEQGGNIQDREITLDVGGGREGVLQEVEAVIDDGAYQSGQFFFVVDPRQLEGYPHVDILALDPGAAPDSLSPISGIKLYRHEVRSGSTPQGVEAGVIQARAVARRPPGADPALPDSTEFRGFFRPLVAGEDYIVHRSRLWIVLRSGLLNEEALAVTYIAASGDTVGDFDAEEQYRRVTNTGQGELPRLVLLRDPATHRPGGITWEREMHQVYRISGSEDVEQGSIELTISQGPLGSGPIIRSFGGADFSFLEIFGLDARPRDDRLDSDRVWRPGTVAGVGGQPVVPGAYLVFPTLEPFQFPPPLSNARVTSLEGQPFPLSEGDLNREIYEEPLDQTRLTSSLYRLNLRYRSRSTGRVSSFSLGAIGIREGSERVTLNGRELVRGRDYSIDYQIGQLTLLRPEQLLGGDTSPQLSIQFEQQPLFDVGRRTILGLTGGFRLADWGTLNFVGLSQSESSVFTRPQIGLEPSSVKIGGVTTDLEFGAPSLTRLMNALPGVNTSAESSLQFSGELAGSLPTTNTVGATYVDDFEGSSGLNVLLDTRAWRFGSPPSRPDADGMGDFLPDVLDLTNRLDAVWQSQWQDGSRVQGPLFIQQIDPALRVIGAQQQEPVFWVSLTDPPAGGGNGWVSITTALSQTGLDLTTSEFLEFYASTLGVTSPNLALIVDLGTVSEDALVPDSLGIANGRGILDQEADPAVGIWGNQDDTGLWTRGCRSLPQATAFPLGDPRANCANNNGLEDTEDLNGDNFLNTEERFFRYVVPLTVPSRYLNRETGGEFQFRLYRLPLREPDLMQGVTEQALQNVKHIRITLVSDREAQVLLSRVSFTGSPWLKRGGTGSVAGTVGEVPGTAGDVTVGPISTRDARYVSPPGITDQQANRTDELSISGQVFNEQALRIGFDNVPAGERIEVFRRFPQTSRNFLTYRQMRLWTLPVGAGWGTGSSLRFFVRLGFDERNFYLFRTRRASAADPPVRDDWRPEIRIDLGRWIALRAEAERRLLARPGPIPADSPLVVWDVDVFPDGDSTYAVVIGDRSRAPNLSAIREMALGVQNIGTTPAGAGEIWIDDLRLDRATDDTGMAARATFRMEAADVLSLQADYTRRNPFFRQLGGEPNFESSWDFDGRADLALGRFLPSSWGLDMPLQVEHGRTANDPFFVPETDVRASEISGLRTGSNDLTRWSIGLSKRTRSSSPILRATLDGLRLGYSRTSTKRTDTQLRSSGSNWAASLAWSRPVADQSIPLLPGFLRDAIDLLPDFLSESTALENLKDLRLRLTPRTLGLGGTLARSRDELRRFQSSVQRPGDPPVRPVVSRDFALRSSASIDVQPFPSLTATVDFSSTRDLVAPFQRVQGPTARSLLRRETGEILGVGIGWETDRSIGTHITYQPNLSSWFEPRLSITTAYGGRRDASYIGGLGTSGDTALVRDISMSRDTRLDLTMYPDRFLAAFGMPESDTAVGGVLGGLRDVWDRLQPIDVSWSERVNAAFDRRDIDPEFDEQFVIGSLSDLRVAGGHAAATAGSDKRWSIRGGYELPFSLSLDAAYARLDTRTITAGSERGVRETEWPDVGLRWNRVPLPGALQGWVNSLSLTVGYRERERATLTTTGQDLGIVDQVWSGSGVLVLPNGFNVTYRYDQTGTKRTDATGSSESDRGSHTLRAAGMLQPPAFLGFLRQPLRLTLGYTLNGNFECRDLGGLGFGGFGPGPGVGGVGGALGPGGCTAHLDETTHNADLTLDTDFTGYSLGVQLSWVRRSSAVGQRRTSDQLNFNIFGRFYFQAGDRPTGPSLEAPSPLGPPPPGDTPFGEPPPGGDPSGGAPPRGQPQGDDPPTGGPPGGEP